MNEYDMYDSLIYQEINDLEEENKSLREEVETWKRRAYSLRQYAPIELSEGWMV